MAERVAGLDAVVEVLHPGPGAAFAGVVDGVLAEEAERQRAAPAAGMK